MIYVWHLGGQSFADDEEEGILDGVIIGYDEFLYFFRGLDVEWCTFEEVVY